MEFRNISLVDLDRAIKVFNGMNEATITLVDPVEKVTSRSVSVKARLKVASVEARYHRLGIPHVYSNGRQKRMTFVCWHGIEDLVRYLLERFTALKIRSAKANYKSLANFEATYRDTDSMLNDMPASPYYGIYYSDLCECNR